MAKQLVKEKVRVVDWKEAGKQRQRLTSSTYRILVGAFQSFYAPRAKYRLNARPPAKSPFCYAYCSVRIAPSQQTIRTLSDVLLKPDLKPVINWPSFDKPYYGLLCQFSESLQSDKFKMPCHISTTSSTTYTKQKASEGGKSIGIVLGLFWGLARSCRYDHRVTPA